VSMCTEKMTDEESRCGRARDEEVYYELRGKFGKSRERTRLTTWRLAHRWVKLTDCSRTSTKLAVREGMHGALHNPTKRLYNRPARPLLQKFFRCAGQTAAPCGARYLS